MPPPTNSHPRPLHLPSSLPTPLPKEICDRTLTSLLASNTIPTLQRTLRAECTSAGWFDAMRARVFEIVRESQDAADGEIEEGNYDVDAIRAILVAEALGRTSRGAMKRGREGMRGEEGEEEEEEYEDDGLGMMVRKKRAKVSENEEGVFGTGKEKGKVDVRIPEQAVQAGTKIVRDALENVVVIDGGEG